MKRILILLFFVAVTMTGCDAPKQPTSETETTEAAEAAAEVNTAQTKPHSKEEKRKVLEDELKKVQYILEHDAVDKDGQTVKEGKKISLLKADSLLIEYSVKQKETQTEFNSLCRRSGKSVDEIEAELVKEKSQWDSQPWFAKVKAARNKDLDLESFITYFTDRKAELEKQIIQLEERRDHLERLLASLDVSDEDDEEVDAILAANDIDKQDEWDNLSPDDYKRKLSSAELAVIKDKVHKSLIESVRNNILKIPGLELTSIEELPALPDLGDIQTPENKAQSIVLGRMKNDSSKMIAEAKKETSEFLKNKQPENACDAWLQIADKLKKSVDDVSEDFEKGFFDEYLKALDVCRNETLRIMSNPYTKTLAQCVKDLDNKDPDWETIVESLEGFYRIRPTLSPAETETLEVRLDTIRLLLKYLVKQNDTNAQVIQQRLKTILDAIDNAYFKEQAAARRYKQAMELRAKKEYEEALSKINGALAIYPDNSDYLKEKEAIELASSPFSAEGKKAGDRATKVINGVEFAFRWIPAGTFMMGSPETEEKRLDTEILHEVTLTKGFWIMETEVTVAMFKAFVDETGYDSRGTTPMGWTGDIMKKDAKYSWRDPGLSQHKNHPVTCVSWYDAVEFCQWLGSKLKGSVQLPTEAQWEYACRAGSSTAYFWGNALNGDKANINGFYPYGTAIEGKYVGKTTPAGSYKPNAWGLFDMHGNVWEWCQDGSRDYSDKSETDPIGPLNDTLITIRGGCWYYDAGRSRSAERYSEFSNERTVIVGFRCVLLVDDQSEAQTEHDVPDAVKDSVQLPETGSKAGERVSITINNVKFVFRWCPPGTFMMGSPEDEKERDDDERQHQVTLTKGFWMLETEVTVGMFKAFVNDTGYKSKGRTPFGWVCGKTDINERYSWLNPGFVQDDNHPVVCVSWDDSIAFCEWLSEKTGQTFQLPTEAQWEYACRAGSTTAFSWGNALNGDRANCNGFRAYGTTKYGFYKEKTTPVASYQSNTWGLYDMHGNVHEWCQDLKADYPDRHVTDPLGNSDDTWRINRGGCWVNPASHCRSAKRSYDNPEKRDFAIGFRCIKCQD
ncbi:MAG: SUMF1/EgtB/PvdO family nonheme iron enzyme [Thermoguttaceae bacterium]|nr:SUMF1/EgtB/PvdO family nonheme iron enzyme [Thermoguttaceae bacterium]